MIEERTLTSDEFLELSEFRGRIYGFLSLVCLQVPSHDFVNRLLGDEVSSLLSTFPFDTGLPQEMEEGLKDIQRFIRTFSGQAVEDVHQSLSVEYTRLFRGIRSGYGPPPPYESVYSSESQALMGRAAFEVQREYAKAGVGTPAEYNEPPDYIGLEFDFMRFLAEKEAESWEKEECDRALGYLNKERDFLGKHILKWVPGFCDKVIEMAELDFYRGTAKMTRGFITDDYERVESFTDALKQ